MNDMTMKKDNLFVSDTSFYSRILIEMEKIEQKNKIKRGPSLLPRELFHGALFHISLIDKYLSLKVSL